MDDELNINTSREGRTATVAIAGEIDLSTVGDLRAAVNAAAAERCDLLLLDLTAVEFIDSTGLGGLLELRSTLRSRGVMLEIVAGDGPVRQAVQITGLSELLAEPLVADETGCATVRSVTGIPSGYGSGHSIFLRRAPMSTTTTLAGTFAADPVHSSFGFAVKYQGVSIFRGTLDEVAATLVDGRLEGAAQVESISIRTPEQFRAHVLSAEFFDAANHPEVKFVSSDLDLADDGSATVNGELTIKGITNPVTATGTWTAPSADAFGNTRAHLQLETVIDRTQWDFNWNLPLPTGGNALANDVTLTVDIALVEQA